MISKERVVGEAGVERGTSIEGSVGRWRWQGLDSGASPEWRV